MEGNSYESIQELDTLDNTIYFFDIIYIILFLFLRYIDDIFMTTNQTDDEIKQKLEQANQKDINIKINYMVNTSVDFLDITIMNEYGQLRTTIYHKPAAEPYILPYTSAHPHHIQRNIPYAALLRAARLCSNVQDFNSERIHIDMSLLLNNYPPNFISKQFNRFFQLNQAMSVLDQLDEHVYQQLHQKLLHQPTRREKQLHDMIQDPIVSPFVLQPKIWNHKIMYPHYLFDSEQSSNFRKQFYKWWKTYYAASSILPVHNVHVRLVADTNRTLENFFIHKKPPRDVLTKMEMI